MAWTLAACVVTIAATGTPGMECLSVVNATTGRIAYYKTMSQCYNIDDKDEVSELLVGDCKAGSNGTGAVVTKTPDVCVVEMSHKRCIAAGLCVINVYQSSPAPAPIYIGCFKDTPKHRMLPDLLFNSTATTAPSCTAGCRAKGYPYAGLQDGTHCYCGRVVYPSRSKGEAMNCQTPCAGDVSTSCGGPTHNAVYYVQTI
eukprot:TRINITY_DN11900_c0_g1_i1.p1 TRINITY_DN11900_c0_g1~~TRINITY_DN11900_c0_g1_i1.p1  ORF type:complete len:200 (+),score=4.62 TRINITY_DN11900_c0_g1_i1:63-662(+)